MSLPADGFSRPVAVVILATLACTFAANHIAARIAFEHHTGLLLAIFCRSGVSVLLLSVLFFSQKVRPTLPAGSWPWQLLMGVLISIQSFCIYSAITRIPVALALLLVNIFPLLLILITWWLGGAAPTRRMLSIMGLILLGLGLALDLPSRLADTNDGFEWGVGSLFSLGAAVAFAFGLWVTSHRLATVPGVLRSLLTMLTVFSSSIVLGFIGALPNGFSFPDTQEGWLGLACLAVFYGAAFSLLFAWIHRLDITRHAPVMNMEPVATLIFAWIFLGQTLAPLQIVGALVVVTGIVLLTTLPDVTGSSKGMQK